jgi:twinkle protein
MTLSLATPREPDQPLVNAEQLIQQATALYRAGGLPRGDSTGWPSVDALYTVATAQVTIVTGTPGSGKSEWLDALIVNLWRRGDWEFAVYSPENFPVATHLVKLVEKDVGKPFGPGPTKRMAESEFRMSALDLCQRIYWLEPDLKTPDELITTGLTYRTEGRKLGIILDPWNTLDHERGGLSETDYVSHVLTRVIRLARSANAHIWLVVHPAKIMRNRDGTRPVPTPYDLSGSAHWYNKADNIVTVHRDQTDDSPTVEIHVQKVRFKHVGHTGLVTLHYDRVTGRYSDPVADAAQAARYREVRGA